MERRESVSRASVEVWHVKARLDHTPTDYGSGRENGFQALTGMTSRWKIAKRKVADCNPLRTSKEAKKRRPHYGYSDPTLS